MRAGLTVGLLAGLGAGFALGWLVRPEECGDVPGLAVARTEPSRAPTHTAPEGPGASGAVAAPTRTEVTRPEVSPTPRAGTTSAVRPDAPELEGQGGPASWRETGWARAALLRHYRKLSGGREIPAEALEAAVEGLAAQTTEAAIQGTTEWWAESGAKGAWQREHLRLVEGTLGNPPVVVLQILQRGPSNLSMAPDPDKALPRSARPLELRAPRPGETEFVYVKGGVIPPKDRFVVERVELRVVAYGQGGGERVRVRLPHGSPVELSVLGPALEATYEGVSYPLRAGEEGDVQLEVGNSLAVEARLTGRLVPDSEGNPAGRPFRLTRFQGAGYMTGGSFRVQVAAGNSRAPRIEFNGKDLRSLRPEERSEREVWDGNVPLKAIEKGRAFVDGLGPLPPGNDLEVTRIVWHVRRLAFESHSRVQISLDGTPILDLPDRSREAEMERDRRQREQERNGDRKKPVEESLEGSWTGRALFSARRGTTLQIDVSGYVMLDVRFEGALVDVPSDQR